MEEIYNRLFKHWDLTRALRVMLGLMVVWYGVDAGDQTVFVGGIILALLPLLNVPCMILPMHLFRKRPKVDPNKEIEFEEVK
jgi:hypothetical protein